MKLKRVVLAAMGVAYYGHGTLSAQNDISCDENDSGVFEETYAFVKETGMN